MTALPLAALLLALAPGPSTPLPPPPNSAAPATLHVVLEGLRSTKGSVRLCIWAEGDGFPDCKNADDVTRLAAPASAETVTVDVAALPLGAYGISVIHDENDNKRLDKSFIGLPTEGVGFSNNASAPFGPPAYKRVRFPVDGDTSETIRLKYYL
ncbi:DUF2141 domain-containing protein [Pacificimonas flava]|uniref:DUF2141 domain-containing protein n=1 Tax=Pacificimonas flava TaxID=1234595 RepID=UPI00068659C3|nr:DUF2141 domain-containing protein [Pacificimonas flava]